MTIAHRFVMFVHLLLAGGFVFYAVLLVALFVEAAGSGYVSEGAKVALGVSGATTACALVVVAGAALWVRTRRRRFLLVGDAFVTVMSWTSLLVLMAFHPIAYVAFLGLTLLAALLVIAIPPPRAAMEPHR